MFETKLDHLHFCSATLYKFADVNNNAKFVSLPYKDPILYISPNILLYKMPESYFPNKV